MTHGGEFLMLPRPAVDARSKLDWGPPAVRTQRQEYPFGPKMVGVLYVTVFFVELSFAVAGA